MNDESMKDLYDKMKESIAKSNVTIGTGQGKKTPISLMSEEKDGELEVVRLKERGDEKAELHREGEPLDAIVNGVVTSRGETVIFTDNKHETVAHIRSKPGATPVAVSLDDLATKGSLVETYHRTHPDEGEPIAPSSEEEFHNIWCPDTTNRPFAQLIERTDEVAVKREVTDNRNNTMGPLDPMPDVSDCTPPMGMVDDYVPLSQYDDDTRSDEHVSGSEPQQKFTVKPVKLSIEHVPVSIRDTVTGFALGLPEDVHLLDQDGNEIMSTKKTETEGTKTTRAVGPRLHPTNVDSGTWSILLDEGTADDVIPKRWLTITKDSDNNTTVQYSGASHAIVTDEPVPSIWEAKDQKERDESQFKFLANAAAVMEGRFNGKETLPDTIVMSVERFIAETKLGHIGRKGWVLSVPGYSRYDNEGNVLTPDVLITRTGTTQLVAKAYDIEVLGEGYQPNVRYYVDPDTVGDTDDDDQ